MAVAVVIMETGIVAANIMTGRIIVVVARMTDANVIATGIIN